MTRLGMLHCIYGAKEFAQMIVEIVKECKTEEKVKEFLLSELPEDAPQILASVAQEGYPIFLPESKLPSETIEVGRLKSIFIDLEKEIYQVNGKDIQTEELDTYGLKLEFDCGWKLALDTSEGKKTYTAPIIG